MTDVWRVGDSYEPYIAGGAGWLHPVPEVAGGSAPPPWLDVGCATGALTTAVLDRCAPSEVIAVDPSKGYIDWASAHVDDPRMRFKVADETHVNVADVVVSGLVLNFVTVPGLPG